MQVYDQEKTKTGNCLPQAVCRTKFREAAMFRTPLSLRPQEQSPPPQLPVFRQRNPNTRQNTLTINPEDIDFRLILILWRSNGACRRGAVNRRNSFSRALGEVSSPPPQPRTPRTLSCQFVHVISLEGSPVNTYD